MNIMANFTIALKKVLKNEGGYANNPNDAGGETYKGISRKNHPTWSGWISIDQIKKAHPKGFKTILEGTKELQDKVKDFYKRNFWDVLHLDDCANQELANQCFDMAVNAGVKAGVKILQKTLGIPADGKLGPVTIAAIKKIK